MELNCLITNFRQYGDKYYQDTNKVILYLDGVRDGERWLFNKNGSWSQISAGSNPVATNSGKWECDGDGNFKITNRTKNTFYDSKNPDAGFVPIVNEPDPTAESTTDDSDFACILKNKNVRGPVATVSSDGNYVSFFVDEPNKVSHIFYKDKNWVQSKDGVQEHTGTWKCDGDHHFTIRSKDESYSSRMNNWDKVIISNDDFPLKFGSQGPRVVKLQKFLNDKLPNNKLTVDGIFDQATEDKLIEFQRKEGII
jgi:hypothetical protein